jgi:hypothetical protein
LIACGDVTLGGNPNEEKCSVIMREHGSMLYGIRIICPFDSACDVKLSFGLVSTPRDLGCIGGFEYRFVQNGKSDLVKVFHDRSKASVNSSVNLVLDSNDKVSFSLFDAQNVEKKYDLDLSGIVRSYTVRGDFVDVKVMKECSLWLYSCEKETVYGSRLPDGKYTFSIMDGCKSEYSYDCLLHNQGPWEVDDVDIHAKIYWK